MFRWVFEQGSTNGGSILRDPTMQKHGNFAGISRKKERMKFGLVKSSETSSPIGPKKTRFHRTSNKVHGIPSDIPMEN